jgi:DnaJ like chaperone protein
LQAFGIFAFMQILAFLILFGLPTLICVLTFQYHKRKYTLEFVDEILILISYIAGADNKFSAIEQKYIGHLLFKRYGKRRKEKFFKKINYHIKVKTNISRSISNLRNEGSMSQRLQILQILIKIATIDGYLTNSESSALSDLTKRLKLTYLQLNSLLAMNNFTSEKDEQKKRTYKKQIKVSNISKVKIALTILELTSSATNQDIKKTYRKLAKLYHPDKGLNLTKLQQKL